MIIKNILRSTLLIILILFLLFNNTNYSYNTLEFENINSDTMLVNTDTNTNGLSYDESRYIWSTLCQISCSKAFSTCHLFTPSYTQVR